MINKEEMRTVITDMFKNLDVNKVDSINIVNGTYDDEAGYTEVTINYVKGGEDE